MQQWRFGSVQSLCKATDDLFSMQSRMGHGHSVRTLLQAVRISICQGEENECVTTKLNARISWIAQTL